MSPTSKGPQSSAPTDSPEVDARVRSALDLVPMIATGLRKHAKRVSIPTEDVHSFGHEGLVVAARTYDASRGVPFRAWATFKIRAAMLDGLRTVGFLPRRLHREIRALEAADAALEARVEEDAAKPCDGPSAADARLAEYLSEVATAMAVALASRSPDEEQVETPEESVARAEVSAQIRDAVGRLPDPEKTLLERHYFGDATLEEAARELGLSKSWGSRLHARAIEMLTRDLKRNRITGTTA